MEEYRDVVASGVHSNFRSPVYYARAKGSRVWDVDGNEFVDCVVSNGACILGHGDPDISDVVKEVLERGLSAMRERGPVSALRKPPILPPVQRMITSEPPMAELIGVVVHTDEDPERAEEIAQELSRMAWEKKRDFVARNIPGGGAPGDGTAILGELLRQKGRWWS